MILFLLISVVSTMPYCLLDHLAVAFSLLLLVPPQHGGTFLFLDERHLFQMNFLFLIHQIVCLRILVHGYRCLYYFVVICSQMEDEMRSPFYSSSMNNRHSSYHFHSSGTFLVYSYDW